MTSSYLYRHTCRLIAVLLSFTLCFDPVVAQSGGISWGAVGISWALSTATTCLLIAVAFGIRGCLKRSTDVKTSNGDEDDIEQAVQGERQRMGPAVLDQHHLVTTSHDKMNSGLLSVSQQSAYLRAQNDTGKNRRKSQTRRGKTEHEPRDWVEQWCEEQAKRESVVAALQTVVSDSPAPSANAREDHLLRYPAGLDLPSTDTRHLTRNDRNKDTVNKRTSALGSAAPKELQPSDIRKETALQRPAGQKLVSDTRARELEVKQTVFRNSSHFQVSTPKMATTITEAKTVSKEPQNDELMPSKTASNGPVLKSQQSVLKNEVIGELKNSPVRVRKYQRDAQKRGDLPQPGAKTKALEFKRPPNEPDPFSASENRKDRFHKATVVVDKGDTKSAPSQTRKAVTSEEEEEEEDEEEEEETEEESDKEPVDPAPLTTSNRPAMSEAKEALPSSQKRGVKRSLSPSADRNESPEITIAVQPTKSSMIESTPPTPLRPTSVRRAPRQSKPSALNIVPVPADGVSPPPGLLPLTASSHHQITKGQRQAATAAAVVSQVAEEKPGRKATERDEHREVERRQKSSKKDKSKERPPSFDFKNKRASAGSDILFFAPELQGTSTPAMRPRSAFTPASVPLLSHDTVDDEDDDDDDEQQKEALTSKGVATSTFLMQRPQLAIVSQSKQFHGILSNSGLHELAHSIFPEWRQLATSLHVPADRQAKLVKTHSSDAEKCTYAMLRGWRDQFPGSKADLRSVLCNALIAVKHPEMAERLIQEDMVGSSEKLDSLKLVSVV